MNLVKDDDSLSFLVQANDKSEWPWQIYFKFVISVIFTITTLSIASVLICWLWNGYFDVTLVYHPSRFMLVKMNTIFTNNNKEIRLILFDNFKFAMGSIIIDWIFLRDYVRKPGVRSISPVQRCGSSNIRFYMFASSSILSSMPEFASQIRSFQWKSKQQKASLRDC